ncbi:MAG: alpha/beta hydrolase [Vicinamibacterales bacterium]|jgi:hypothetical protein|nr:alpha/beta hydrolase [Acidobacteriota bacterium]MDP7294509.1 alpha/beta hydrolase [Vicinamibacterales bacterium]MDP7472288.1 alpha/beta hydrolase [Vicinamibacterales bacterium]MDP7670653.1 alpha/beta hydrolase [Vicinamibacterales bacterium]HJO39064.1 alpha/beta hydrolase [Vicinamibacterales bacterium]|tara:strand:+ start:1539 stop:2387 length:849 start_codon:yes stop_codon:yes gene_type:complete
MAKSAVMTPWWRTPIRIGATAAAVWLLLVGGLMLFERHLIYFPIGPLAAEPRDYGLDAEELRLRASDGVELHGWHFRENGDRVLVWFHGNAGNISHRLDNAQRLVRRFGLDIILVDYRGYGLSDGTPDEAGLYLDGLAMYQAALDAGFASGQVVVFGRSIGAAVALDVAVKRPVGALVLESPFLSLPELARRHYPFVPAALVRTQFDSRRKIARVSAPMLVLHGDRDDIVPIAHGRTLFDLAPEPKRFHTIHGAGHNDTYDVGGDDYWEAWRVFLEGLKVEG